jgi:ribulose-phosphate 3-epimerase
MEIVPSILGWTVEEMKEQINILQEHVPVLHLDLMDGHFVPEATPREIDFIKDTQPKYDLHIMSNYPDGYIDSLPFEKLRYIYVPVEIEERVLSATIGRLIGKDVSVGLSINPETSPTAIDQYVLRIKSILVMCVNPGESGRPFMPEAIDRFDRVRELFPLTRVSVDGGINEKTIPTIYGADEAVVHSAIFNQENPAAAWWAMQQKYSEK